MSYAIAYLEENFQVSHFSEIAIEDWNDQDFEEFIHEMKCEPNREMLIDFAEQVGCSVANFTEFHDFYMASESDEEFADNFVKYWTEEQVNCAPQYVNLVTLS